MKIITFIKKTTILDCADKRRYFVSMFCDIHIRQHLAFVAFFVCHQLAFFHLIALGGILYICTN